MVVQVEAESRPIHDESKMNDACDVDVGRTVHVPTVMITWH